MIEREARTRKNLFALQRWKWLLDNARWPVVLFAATLGIVLLAGATNPRGSYGRAHFWDSAWLVTVGVALLWMAWAASKRSTWALVLAPIVLLGCVVYARSC